MVSTVRDEHQKQLKSISTAAQKAAITTRIDKANEKIQVDGFNVSRLTRL